MIFLVKMQRFLLVGVLGGILFGMMDGFINGNPLAQKLFKVYEPIAKRSINVPAGFAIDLVYGLIMAWVFVILRESLPGETGFMKGISFGVGIWFFRVVMSIASSWMMHKIPLETLGYSMVTGLLEMLVLGVFYGLLLK